MAKQIAFSQDARTKLINGVNLLSKAVVTTLGPRGRNVALDRKWGAPNVVHDGVSVAKEIDLEDPFENMGAQLVKEAASKTNDIAGDGTTTSTLLTQAIVNAGMANITAGTNSMILRRGLELALEKVVVELRKMAKKVPLNDKEAITQVATISAGDDKIGQMIAEATIDRAITMMDITVLSYPVARPARMVVAGPVLVALAISLTGRYLYSV